MKSRVVQLVEDIALAFYGARKDDASYWDGDPDRNRGLNDARSRVARVVRGYISTQRFISLSTRGRRRTK